MEKEMTDTIIFDLDGTLLDTLEDLTDSVNYAMEQFHLRTRTIEEVRGFVGNGVAKLIERCIPQGTQNPLYEQILASFKEHYALHCEDKTRPYEGIMELLAKLSEQGYHMAIVSNKFDGAVKQLNEKYFKDYISVAIGESAAVKKKPAPDTVYQALLELACDASQAVYVGDSEVDRQTAGNVPMPCVSVTWGFRTRQQLMEAGAADAYMIKSPQELLPLLRHFPPEA
ncbi:MAG: HAD-IA family hydrolase [Lachnospiraceae bacterium]|nr:HAD-IA family hydrolase [Lachnospiraceae bacterium]